jgi:hypothetical protein
MARRAARKKAPPQPQYPETDATPERLAKEDSEIVDAAIGSANERRGKARQFRSSHLDRLHKSGALTYVQWYAGNIYRETHAKCSFALCVVASYGERTNAGEHPGSFGFGLPRQQAQLIARGKMKDMRSQWAGDMRGFMDRLLIHDSMPRYGGRAAMRNLAQIRNGLDQLASYLRLTWAENSGMGVAIVA